MSEENQELQITDGERQIYEAAQASPFVANDPEVQEVVKKVESVLGSQQTQAPTQQMNEEPDGQEKTNANNSQDNEPVKPPTTEEVASIFNQKRVNAIEFDESISNFIKDKYSIDNPDTFINSVDNWRRDAQKKVELEKEYNALVDNFTSLPKGINDILDAYSTGQDWTEVAKSSIAGLDYSKSFSNQNTEDIVKHYFKDFYIETKNNLDEGDISDIEYKEQLARFSTAAKSLYEQDRTRLEHEKTKIVESQKEQLEKLSGSARKSLEVFRNGNPIFSHKSYQSKLDKIYKDLDGNNISRYFVDKDGTWKPEAVERLFYAVYGKEEGEKALEAARKDGISQGRQDVVDRGNKTPNVGTSQTSGMTENQMMENLRKTTFVGSTFKSNPFAPKVSKK